MWKRMGNKGGLGQVIEEGLFRYGVNSRNEADFAELGVELAETFSGGRFWNSGVMRHNYYFCNLVSLSV